MCFPLSGSGNDVAVGAGQARGLREFRHWLDADADQHQRGRQPTAVAERNACNAAALAVNALQPRVQEQLHAELRVRFSIEL